MHTGFSWTSLECGRHLSDWRTLHLQVFQISHVIVKQDKKRICELDDLTVASKLHQKHTTALLLFTDIVVRHTDTRVAFLPWFRLHDICPNVMSLNSSTPWKPVYSDQMFFLPTNVCPTLRQCCLPLLMAQSWLLRYGVWRVIAGQGTVTYVSPVEAFVTGIKMVSSDQPFF